ncbi:transposase [Actinomadura sp. K4S16]|uniref:transposase n=1 Tax=Actinomadura sp. K4S16 TaxID=1316147 RepID=UPI0035CFE6D3
MSCAGSCRGGDGSDVVQPRGLIDDEWALGSSCFPAPGGGRRPEEHLRREVVGAVYVVRTGCAWRQLPAGSLPGGLCAGTSCGGG